MITVLNSDQRGRTRIDWLDSYHSFSFGDFYNPSQMGFRSLRVINEDFIEAGKGFGLHPHKNMEILTYVITGVLEHEDSLGNVGSISPGEIQRMSAGTGIRHAERTIGNERVHLLQIWIVPDKTGYSPRYDQKKIPLEDKTNKLCKLISPEKTAEGITIHQDVYVYASILESEKSVSYQIKKDRGVWIQNIRGTLNCNGTVINPGDAVAIENESDIKVESLSESEFLLFDLA